MELIDFKCRVFLSAARHLSFSKAAKELSLTQPAVSFQIRHLEEELGERVFLRYPNRVELTSIGRLLLKELKEIAVRSGKSQEKIMRKLGKLMGTVAVGASSTVGNHFLPPVLADFKNLYDEAGLKVLVGNTNEVLGYLQDGIIDFAIVEGPVKSRQWDIEEAFVDELVIIAPTDFPCMGKGAITKKQLSAQPFISREPGSGTRAVVDSLKFGKRALISPSNIVLELGSNIAIKRVVESGLGVSIVSFMTVEREIRHRTLSVIRIAGFPIHRQIVFVFPHGKDKNMLVEEMVRLCRKRAGEIEAHTRADTCVKTRAAASADV